MKEALIIWMTNAWKVLSYSHRRIIWNSFLAYIPLVLSFWLFRSSRPRSLAWWLVFLVFIAFLPNAPYVLTDIIHPIDFIRRGYSVWIVTLAVIPQYFLFILAGFEAYVISLMNFGYYLEEQRLKQYILTMELVIHALCAVGIYLGRFKRFNSWDFVTQPDILAKSIVNDLTGTWEIAIIIITFIVLAVLYWLMKQVTLAILFRFRYRKVLEQKSNQ